MHMVGNAAESKRHQRKWQQCGQCQPPVNAGQHHTDHQSEGNAAVETRQRGFACGQFNRVRIIGAHGHQVAGFLLIKKSAALQTEFLIQPRP